MKLPFISRKAYDLLRKEKREIDWLMWFMGITGPLSTIPQIYTIFANESASNVSFLSWFLYVIASVVGLLYGVVHRLKPLIVSYILWTIANAAVAVGVLIYG
jgi:uncharacterized protein with PQ loop repeat